MGWGTGDRSVAAWVWVTAFMSTLEASMLGLSSVGGADSWTTVALTLGFTWTDVPREAEGLLCFSSASTSWLFTGSGSFSGVSCGVSTIAAGLEEGESVIVGLGRFTV